MRLGRIITFVLAAIAAVFGVAANTGAAENKEPVSVSIQCPQSEVKSGAEVKLFITVTNTSDQDVHVFKAPGADGHAEDENKIEVRDETGNLLPRADVEIAEIGGRQHKIPKRIKISRAGVLLKPGENLTDFSILSDLFDLSKPGTYTVTAQNERRSEDESPDLNFIYAKSNTITITVTE
jgi:hypothetical protein